MSNEIAVVLHNHVNYNYNFFIIKELGNKFEGKFECLGENTEKCKDDNKSVVTNYILQKKIYWWCKVYVKFMFCSFVISQTEFTKLNVKITIAFLNIKVSRTIQ